MEYSLLRTILKTQVMERLSRRKLTTGMAQLSNIYQWNVAMHGASYFWYIFKNNSIKLGLDHILKSSSSNRAL